MNDKNESKDQEKKPQGSEDSSKELNDILGQLKESEGKTPEEKPKQDKGDEIIEKMHPKGKETEKDSEGLEDILNSITEKEQETPVESMNVFQRFIGVFTAPGKVFDYLKAKPDFWIPLILAVVISIISGYMFFDVAINDQITRIEQNENIPADRKDAILDQIEASREGSRKIINSVVIAPIFVVVIYLIIPLIFLLIGSVFLGGKAHYKQLLSVFSYSYLIVIFLGTLVKAPLIMAKNTVNIQMSPAAFLDPEQISGALYRFIGSFDIFVIWFLIVFALGFSTIYGFSKLKGLLSVFIAWLLYVLIVNVVISGFFQGLLG